MFNKKLFEGINDELKNIDGKEDNWIEKNEYNIVQYPNGQWYWTEKTPDGFEKSVGGFSSREEAKNSFHKLRPTAKLSEEEKELHLTDKDIVRDFNNFEYVLEYEDLPITVAGEYHAAWWDGFKGIGSPAYYDDKEVKVDYELTLDWYDFRDFVSDQDETFKLYDEYLGREATDDELNSKEYTNWIFDNAEKIAEKLEDKLYDHFEDRAIEKAEENYEEETDY